MIIGVVIGNVVSRQEVFQLAETKGGPYFEIKVKASYKVLF